MFPRLQGFLQSLSRDLHPNLQNMHVPPYVCNVEDLGTNNNRINRDNSSKAERKDSVEDEVKERLGMVVFAEESEEEENSEESYETKVQGKCTSDTSTCKCFNCKDILARFSECSICLDSLQGGGVSACNRCGGIWCKQCTSKMTRCPFCRVHKKRFNTNMALVRLIDELSLPCRNYRRGCPKFLTKSTRTQHEDNCSYEQIRCPVDDSCSATFTFEELKEHMATAHSAKAKYSTEINILLTNLYKRLKQSSTTKTRYQVYLLCHRSAFVVNISTYSYRLIVEVVKKNLVQRSEGCKKNEYFALIEFQSTALTSRSAVPIEPFKSLAQRAEIHYNEFNLRHFMDAEVFINVAITPFKGD